MPYRTKISLIYLLGFALDLLNMFALNSAYPLLGQELNASVMQLSGVGNLYLIGLSLVIPFGTWLARRIGERQTLLVSLALFGLGTLLAAMASSIDSLLLWRLLQGLGGGLLIPVGQAMAYRACPPQQRPALTAQVMMIALLVPALSPALGGLLVDHASWRWIFLALLPLVLLTGLLALAWLPAREPASQSAHLLDLGLLRQPLLRTAMLVYLCVPGVFIGANLVATLYLQDRLHLSATATGALMLPWSLGALLAIAVVRWCFNRSGPRRLLGAGILLQSLALVGLSEPGLALSPYGLVLVFALLGLGSSLCSSSTQSLAFVAIAPERMAAASALWSLNRQLSFCLGAAVLSALLNHLLPAPEAYAQVLLVAAALSLLALPAVLTLPGASALKPLTSSTES
ncbi:MFS transporter [Pseudomonas sp. BJa5]|uniref:MFS transporter n=1 Tax=Pseudomonas sp. BJa5 TaxID=2936270 RepID=UPI00255A221D|nr:MFS transporter [Pseudomonas sp. BGr12]MDL2419879.1 MFS transporter [Pseudomonas sp. BGr12]